MVCLCDAQFHEQGEVLHSGDGQTFTHYHGTQFGAKRLSTMDGKHVLAAHSLFTVLEFAFDWVKLVGASPPALKGKYVELTIAQWTTMFKIVHESKGDTPTDSYVRRSTRIYWYCQHHPHIPLIRLWPPCTPRTRRPG